MHSRMSHATAGVMQQCLAVQQCLAMLPVQQCLAMLPVPGVYLHCMVLLRQHS